MTHPARPHRTPLNDRSKRALRWLQPLLGAAILALVASKLPWADELSVVGPDGQASVVEGEIDGDWRGQRVLFQPSGTSAPGFDAARELTRSGDGGWLLDGAAAELRPSIQRVFRGVDRRGLAAAMGCFFAALLFGVTRWCRLLRLAGCSVRWLDCFRLTYLGLFFNLVVPGLTGGDVIKALLAAKENPGKRADALVSVVVDRVLGLGTLAGLATVVILFLGAPFDELRLPVALVLAAMVGGALMYINARLRTLVRFDALLERLPLSAKLKEVDAAIMTYTRHPGEMVVALGLSLGNHFGAIAGVMALSLAFGVGSEAIGWWDYVAIVPVANMISSLPIAPGGWGVGEAAYGFLYELLGQSAALGVAVSVSFRLCQVLLGLAGGLYLLRPGASAEVHQAEAEAEGL